MLSYFLEENKLDLGEVNELLEMIAKQKKI
ncbi:hypothetical protein L950_0207920 [Sphingobacterium sp. IITKGP-BTPF85]|nr:hypothetical protein L950_0207920 [Sphingobacterium sp. IITKGP-BTPF85]